jgi:hypothetical protein
MEKSEHVKELCNTLGPTHCRPSLNFHRTLLFLFPKPPYRRPALDQSGLRQNNPPFNIKNLSKVTLNANQVELKLNIS